MSDTSFALRPAAFDSRKATFPQHSAASDDIFKRGWAAIRQEDGFSIEGPEIKGALKELRKNKTPEVPLIESLPCGPRAKDVFAAACLGRIRCSQFPILVYLQSEAALPNGAAMDLWDIFKASAPEGVIRPASGLVEQMDDAVDAEMSRNAGLIKAGYEPRVHAVGLFLTLDTGHIGDRIAGKPLEGCFKRMDELERIPKLVPQLKRLDCYAGLTPAVRGEIDGQLASLGINDLLLNHEAGQTLCNIIAAQRLGVITEKEAGEGINIYYDIALREGFAKKNSALSYGPEALALAHLKEVGETHDDETPAAFYRAMAKLDKTIARMIVSGESEEEDDDETDGDTTHLDGSARHTQQFSNAEMVELAKTSPYSAILILLKQKGPQTINEIASILRRKSGMIREYTSWLGGKKVRLIMRSDEKYCITVKGRQALKTARSVLDNLRGARYGKSPNRFDGALEVIHNGLYDSLCAV